MRLSDLSRSYRDTAPHADGLDENTNISSAPVDGDAFSSDLLMHLILNNGEKRRGEILPFSPADDQVALSSLHLL